MRSDPFVETLLNDTAETLRLAHRQCDGIRGAVYLFLCRAYEARLSSEAVMYLLGVAGDCVLNRACLEPSDEDEALEAYASYDEMLREQYAGGATMRRGRLS
jgi:hypothetical protein